uniref:C-type lectin domain-containing protein n=1 Tax=Erpetoichthys calabaricus TaxID=27687 RepID=A0A8C4RTV0_ERPCA
MPWQIRRTFITLLSFKHSFFICSVFTEIINISERYVWINSRMNWSSTQNYCQVNYTDLGSIRNESENQEIMEKAQGSPFWTVFQIWAQNEPDNYLRNEACVEILSDGTWNDDFCGKMNYFFLLFLCSHS